MYIPDDTVSTDTDSTSDTDGSDDTNSSDDSDDSDDSNPFNIPGYSNLFIWMGLGILAILLTKKSQKH